MDSFKLRFSPEKGGIAVDDTILVKGHETSAGSRILEGFVPLFSAEAVERAEKAGYPVAGKTHVGEFGLDLLGEFSHYAPAAEGDSLTSAAAEAVKTGEARAALCVDLSGTPRRAAALNDLVFIKPTYGTVSRYGVIPCACSGEQIGVMAQTAADAAELLSVIAGHDAKDGTSLPQDKYEYSTALPLAGKRVGILSDLLRLADEDVKKKVGEAAERLKAAGCTVEEDEFPFARAARPAWQILQSAETCNNISRYDGVKFGYRAQEYTDIDELYVKSRTEGFNLLTKQTLLYGSDVLSKGRYEGCYDRALRTRRIVVDKLASLFGQYDLVLCPACASSSYKAYPIEQAFDTVYRESVFTALSSISGTPAVGCYGVQLMAPAFGESLLLSAAAILGKEETRA